MSSRKHLDLDRTVRKGQRSTAFRVGVFAVLSAVALSLTACSTAPGTDFLGEPAPSSASQPAASPEAEPAVLEGDRDGNGKLSEHEKGVLAMKAPRDYTLPDGTVIKVDPAQPLPAPVVDSIRAQAAPIIATYGTNIPTSRNLREFATSQYELTGKSLVIVMHIPNAVDGRGWTAVVSGSNAVIMQGQATQAEASALAQAYADSRGAEVISVG